MTLLFQPRWLLRLLFPSLHVVEANYALILLLDSRLCLPACRSCLFTYFLRRQRTHKIGRDKLRGSVATKVLLFMSVREIFPLCLFSIQQFPPSNRRLPLHP